MFTDRQVRYQHGKGPCNVFILDTSLSLGIEGFIQMRKTFSTIIDGNFKFLYKDDKKNNEMPYTVLLSLSVSFNFKKDRIVLFYSQIQSLQSIQTLMRTSQLLSVDYKRRFIGIIPTIMMI